MKPMMPRASVAILLALAGEICSPLARAQDVVAVLSSDSSPYMEALEGVKEVVGVPVKVVNLAKSERWSDQASVIIAIGGKAASQSYPRSTPLIYCVAPAVFIDKATHPGPLARIFISPAPPVVIERVREMQPALKRLGTLWMNSAANSYFETLTTIGATQGITVIPMQVDSLGELLSKLRSLKGHVDALWLAPDPSLINPKSFASIKEFALSNDIPLYVAMDSLVGEGASAAVSVSFREMGRKAGTLAAQAPSGSMSSSDSYGDRTKLTVNISIAAQSGLTFPASVLKKADRVIP